MATRQRLLRISFYSKRNPKLTEAGFRKHWTEIHAPLANKWLAKHGIIRYNQLHTPLSMKELGIGANPAFQHLPWLEYDGVAEFWTTDIQNLNRAFQDPYCLENVYPDEHELFDFASNRWNVGWEEVFVKDGKPVNPQAHQDTPT
ncbi:hypothetical protein CEP51_015248 [Fusarium floridanum]|uniref:EthD domain-containing protein n=1 Tax=Fusarium floridanum TaxID=1325733 RepID=A0A428PDH0_9HYPO|nr:hypothetical protein CEP51_015248 [Fusarium floridanum]